MKLHPLIALQAFSICLIFTDTGTGWQTVLGLLSLVMTVVVCEPGEPLT